MKYETLVPYKSFRKVLFRTSCHQFTSLSIFINVKIYPSFYLSFIHLSSNLSVCVSLSIYPYLHLSALHLSIFFTHSLSFFLSLLLLLALLLSLPLTHPLPPSLIFPSHHFHKTDLGRGACLFGERGGEALRDFQRV